MIYPNYLQYYNSLTKRRKRIYRRKWLKSGKQEQAPKSDYSLAADILNRFWKPWINEYKRQLEIFANKILIDFISQYKKN